MDAQLPRRLASWLSHEGHDVLHTLKLPERNQTPDAEINRISLAQERIVITKDADFVNSFLPGQGPYKPLLISTENITNHALIALFERNLDVLVERCDGYYFVELNRATIITHA